MEGVYLLLADLIVLLHGLIVAFNVIGLIAIVFGMVFCCRWVRNPYFRWAHLVSIGVVGVQGALGILCPLTILEDYLRQLAGQRPESATFIARWIHRLIFVDVPLPILNSIYVAAAGFVVAAMLFFPPRPFRQRFTTEDHVDDFS